MQNMHCNAQSAQIRQFAKIWQNMQTKYARNMLGSLMKRRQSLFITNSGQCHCSSGLRYVIVVADFAHCACKKLIAMWEQHTIRVRFLHGSEFFDSSNMQQNLIPLATAYNTVIATERKWHVCKICKICTAIPNLHKYAKTSKNMQIVCKMYARMSTKYAKILTNIQVKYMQYLHNKLTYAKMCKLAICTYMKNHMHKYEQICKPNMHEFLFSFNA